MDAFPSRPAATTRPRFQELGRAFLATPETVRACRRVIRAGLFAHGLADLSDDACAVAAELAANAVNATAAARHGGRYGSPPPAIVMSLEWLSDGVRIGFWDGSPDLPSIGLAGQDDESGRGLLIVEALTGGQWGWFTVDGGKCVWAEVVRAAARPACLTRIGVSRRRIQPTDSSISDRPAANRAEKLGWWPRNTPYLSVSG